MIEADKRKAIFLLHQEGMGRNQIARRLRISRNTVRAIIAQKGEMPLSHARRQDPDRSGTAAAALPGMRRLRAAGAREAGRGGRHPDSVLHPDAHAARSWASAAAAEPRCDRVPDEPGAEMQHDTTVYPVQLGEHPCQAWSPACCTCATPSGGT